MPDALILEFTGATADQYKAVNAILGIDAATGEGDWPAGLLSHTGAAGAGGDLVVFEVWDSKESQEAFMASRLGPALSAKRGFPSQPESSGCSSWGTTADRSIACALAHRPLRFVGECVHLLVGCGPFEAAVRVLDVPRPATRSRCS
jgi:hypothetical protein